MMRRRMRRGRRRRVRVLGFGLEFRDVLENFIMVPIAWAERSGEIWMQIDRTSGPVHEISNPRHFSWFHVLNRPAGRQR